VPNTRLKLPLVGKPSRLTSREPRAEEVRRDPLLTSVGKPSRLTFQAPRAEEVRRDALHTKSSKPSRPVAIERKKKIGFLPNRGNLYLSVDILGSFQCLEKPYVIPRSRKTCLTFSGRRSVYPSPLHRNRRKSLLVGGLLGAAVFLSVCGEVKAADAGPSPSPEGAVSSDADAKLPLKGKTIGE
jgi:hypothetical protein